MKATGGYIPDTRLQTTADFTQPEVGGTVVVQVTQIDDLYVGQPVVVAGFGQFLITAINGNNLTLKIGNCQGTATHGTIVPAGSWVIGSGMAGMPGVKGDKGDTGNQGVQGVKGDTGLTGIPGRGITSEVYNASTGVLTLTFSDSTTYATGDLRGSTGVAGKGITSSSYNASTGVLTLTFSDSTTYATGDLRGATGVVSATSPITYNSTTKTVGIQPATTSQDGYMTKEQVQALAATKKVAVGQATVAGTLVAGGSVDLTITLDQSMNNTSYYVGRFITPVSVSVLGSLAVVVKTKNLSSVVVTVSNTGLVSIAAGTTIEVVAFG